MCVRAAAPVPTSALLHRAPASRRGRPTPSPGGHRYSFRQEQRGRDRAGEDHVHPAGDRGQRHCGAVHAGAGRASARSLGAKQARPRRDRRHRPSRRDNGAYRSGGAFATPRAVVDGATEDGGAGARRWPRPGHAPYLEAPEVALLTMLETVLGPLWAFLAFPETQRPSLTTLVSGGVPAHPRAELAIARRSERCTAARRAACPVQARRRQEERGRASPSCARHPRVGRHSDPLRRGGTRPVAATRRPWHVLTPLSPGVGPRALLSVAGSSAPTRSGRRRFAGTRYLTSRQVGNHA